MPLLGKDEKPIDEFKRHLKSNVSPIGVHAVMTKPTMREHMHITTVAAFHLGIATEGREYQATKKFRDDLDRRNALLQNAE